MSNPTVMTKNGSASDRQTGSMGTLSRYAASRATRKANVDEMRVAKAVKVDNKLSYARILKEERKHRERERCATLLTQPKARSKFPHVDEQMDKGHVHHDVSEEHDKDVRRVGILRQGLAIRSSSCMFLNSPWLESRIA